MNKKRVKYRISIEANANKVEKILDRLNEKADRLKDTLNEIIEISGRLDELKEIL